VSAQHVNSIVTSGIVSLPQLAAIHKQVVCALLYIHIHTQIDS